jgi:hypothetical protein
MNGAVHRLHSGVSEEGNLINRLDLADRTRHCLVDITDILRHRSRIKRRLFELVCDFGGVELGVRTIVPFDRKRPPSPLPAASAPSTRRSVAVCDPSWETENRTRYAISATTSPFVSILNS